jgi:hypothetical protein
LSELKVEVVTYYSMMEIPAQEDEDVYEDYDDEEFNEDFY